MLDPIHRQGLRLALGAFRTSPTASVYVEADEPSLNTRREKLSLQYAIRIAENNSNPAHDVTFQPKYMDLYESKPNFIKSFVVRILPVLESANINFNNIDKTFTPNVPALCIINQNFSSIYTLVRSQKQVLLSSNLISKS